MYRKILKILPTETSDCIIILKLQFELKFAWCLFCICVGAIMHKAYAGLTNFAHTSCIGKLSIKLLSSKSRSIKPCSCANPFDCGICTISGCDKV